MDHFQRSLASEISHDLSIWLDDTLFLMPNWKWAGLVLGVAFGFFILKIARPILKSVKHRYAEHNSVPKSVRYFLQKDVHLPVAYLLAAGIWHLVLHGLDLHEGFTTVMALLIHLLILLNLMRLVYFAVEAMGLALEDYFRSKDLTEGEVDKALDSQLAPFATRVLKIVVISFGFLMCLQSLGLNVGALLAGLGIGSLAFALAAQDTVANLFGSITIIFDRPFQRGDLIKIGDTEGTIEEVGFRSTRIRTGYKSIITVPNAIMAKEKIDNFGMRPNRRFRHVLGIAVDTPPTQIEMLMQKLRDLLKGNPQISANEVGVQLQKIGEFDLKISIEAFINTNSDAQEAKIQDHLLLSILNLVHENKISLPYPTHTVNLVEAPAR